MSTRDLWPQVDVETPVVSLSWREWNPDERMERIARAIGNLEIAQSLSLDKCLDDGEIFFIQESPIPSGDRADLLLDLEDLLKQKVDPGLTVWIEPQGDKSSLRKLRGVQVKSL